MCPRTARGHEPIFKLQPPHLPANRLREQKRLKYKVWSGVAWEGSERSEGALMTGAARRPRQLPRKLMPASRTDLCSRLVMGFVDKMSWQEPTLSCLCVSITLKIMCADKLLFLVNNCRSIKASLFFAYFIFSLHIIIFLLFCRYF